MVKGNNDSGKKKKLQLRVEKQVLGLENRRECSEKEWGKAKKEGKTEKEILG